MKKSRLNAAKQSRLIKNFVAKSTVADLVGVNSKTAAYYFLRLRNIIALELKDQRDENLLGEFEIDESYFGGVSKGKRDRRTVGKTFIFSLLNCQGQVIMFLITNSRAKILIPLIRQTVKPDISFIAIHSESTMHLVCRSLNTTVLITQNSLLMRVVF